MKEISREYKYFQDHKYSPEKQWVRIKTKYRSFWGKETESINWVQLNILLPFWSEISHLIKI
jgi:hypothetical protein